MMPRVLITRRVLVTALSASAAAWLAAACADRVTGPGDVAPLAITAQQRSALASGLAFASRDEALAGGTAGHLLAAFERLAEQIERNDARGARTALREARAALERHRAAAGEDPMALMEIEMMAVALEHAALLVDAPAR